MPRRSNSGLKGGPGSRPPWLSCGLCLVIFLSQVALLQGHPQCLDYGPPFRPSRRLEFCSDYGSFGCCDQHKDRRVAARYQDIMDYFDLRGHELCGGYIKDILCQVGPGHSPEGMEREPWAGYLPALWDLRCWVAEGGYWGEGTQPSWGSPARYFTLELQAPLKGEDAELGFHRHFRFFLWGSSEEEGESSFQC